jgi:hypothetical protein
MGRHVHDPAFAHIVFRRRRHEACPEAMTTELVNLDAEAFLRKSQSVDFIGRKQSLFVGAQ